MQRGWEIHGSCLPFSSASMPIRLSQLGLIQCRNVWSTQPSALPSPELPSTAKPPARAASSPCQACQRQAPNHGKEFHSLQEADQPRFPIRDVMFVVGQEQQKVFAHRCVLACRCQVFRGMLSQDSSSSVPPQGPFVLGHVQPEVFLAVIEFLYTNSVTLNSHIALEVLTSSVEYGLQDLCKLCVKFIKDTLSVEQVCEALQAAVTYGQVDLQQHCLAFIEGCTTAVLGRPVPEVAALPVRELRLPLLAPSELVTLESHNQQDLLIPVENIAAAWRAHALRRGSGVPSRLCRPRRGTRPRDHHRHLEPHAK
ncbi:BTB/POZ domain-containing protein 19 isoform 3-T3 [Geothlypis trichas]